MATIEVGPYIAVVPDDADLDSPVVVLLGWAGATDRPLSKFADVLGEAGYPSVRCVQPISYLFAPVPYWRRQWAIGLLRFLEQQALTPPRPLVIYAFSNGGASIVEQIVELVEHDPRYGRYRELIAGFIFDSAPAAMTDPLIGLRVLEASMEPGARLQAAKLAFRVSAWLNPMSGKRQDRFWDAMLRLDWGKPLLYLYSQDDPLTDADALTLLVEEKRHRGHRVQARKWEQSDHVAHFKLHRQEYLDMLLPFLEALPRGPPPPRSKL